MGTKNGPSYVCIFMRYFEYIVSQQYRCTPPELYKPYIDDGICIDDLSLKEPIHFIEFIGVFYPAIKFTSSISYKSFNCLGLSVSITTSRPATSVHYKPRDAHNCLLYSSNHPEISFPSEIQ